MKEARDEEEREGREGEGNTHPPFNILSPHMLNMMERMKGEGETSPMNLSSERDEKPRISDGRCVIKTCCLIFIFTFVSSITFFFLVLHVIHSIFLLVSHSPPALVLPSSPPPATPRPPLGSIILPQIIDPSPLHP